MADLTTTNSATTIVTEGLGGLGIQLTGTFSAVATFSASVDNSNYITAAVLPVGSTNLTSVTTATTTGVFTVPNLKGIRSVKVTLTTYTSGTCTVTASPVK